MQQSNNYTNKYHLDNWEGKYGGDQVDKEQEAWREQANQLSLDTGNIKLHVLSEGQIDRGRLKEDKEWVRGTSPVAQ